MTGRIVSRWSRQFPSRQGMRAGRAREDSDGAIGFHECAGKRVRPSDGCPPIPPPGDFPTGRQTGVANEDILLAAQGMLIAHGENAVGESETVLATMAARGDEAGAKNWTKILAAVRDFGHEVDGPARLSFVE